MLNPEINIKTFRAIVIFLAVAILSFYFFTKKHEQISSENSGKNSTKNEQNQEIPAQSLQAILLQKQNITTFKELPARTNAFKIAQIRPQVSGIITERLFEEGSFVEEGQQLYQIDESVYRASYESALADLQRAEANIKSIESKAARFEELIKIDAISKQEFDDAVASLAQARADVAVAKSRLASAKIDLDYTKVYAPISGVIGASSVTKGALVEANQAEVLATITVLDPIYVDITQPAEDLMQIRRATENYNEISVLLFSSKENIPYKYEGKLQFHEVNVDRGTGSVLLRSLFPNPEKMLLPGLFVRTKLKIEQNDVILIPQESASRKPDGSLQIWLLDENSKTQAKIIVASGVFEGNWIVKDESLVGKILVTEGLIAMRPEVLVEPIL